MATRKTRDAKTANAPSRDSKSAPSNGTKRPAVRKPAPAATPAIERIGSVLGTVSGPSTSRIDLDGAEEFETDAQQRLAAKQATAQRFAEEMPHNPLKPAEHGLQAGHVPQAGTPLRPSEDLDTSSTVTEDTDSEKLGDGIPRTGYNAGNEPLDRVRVDSGGQALTTNQGVRVADNQNSLKAGLRGPALLEDFILREKITHFDHERIPERVVHARGSAAHGYFECYESLAELTKAAPFAEAGKRTPVFVRFSTVAGERGSTDTARDVRGFAVKFYTDEGNWDLVGNNMPVFFIQDAMKFPDLVHALKPEPHFAMPQASSAHDTFWDFVSLMPESTHMLMWVMSDRAIPRSYRMMQGLRRAHVPSSSTRTASRCSCKFHWSPLAGTHSLVWDEAVKISGADPDFHRRDLWEAIEAGAFPEYELGLQIFSEEQADGFGFDVLDATKIVPEELVPVRPVGRLVLNRNPDNFFAETEQVAFCTAHIVPGIDFTNDPLLQGRIHSYVDTQLTRLGGPNFHEIPINASVAQVHNNQRDGLHRQAIHRGRVSYEPNSLGGGCPFQAGTTRLRVLSRAGARRQGARQARAVRRPLLAGDACSGTARRRPSASTSSRRSASSSRACRRKRCASAWSRCSSTSPQSWPKASRAGSASRCRRPQPLALERESKSEVEASAGAVAVRATRRWARHHAPRRVARRRRRGRRVAARGARSARTSAGGAALRRPPARRGAVRRRPADRCRGVARGGAVGAVGRGRAARWRRREGVAAAGHALEFVKEQYRHCKPMLVLGKGSALLRAAGVNTEVVGRPSRSGPRDRRDVGREHDSAGKHRRTRRSQTSSQHSPSTGTSSANRTRPRCSCAGSKIGRAGG